jgi:hypothetical protein
MLIWTIFHVLVSGTRAQILSEPFSYALYTPRYRQRRKINPKEASPTKGITSLSQTAFSFVFRSIFSKRKIF